MFCVLRPPFWVFNTHALWTARSASAKSGTSKFLVGSDHSPKIVKWQGMKLLTFFDAYLCQLGGTEIRCEEETGSQNAGLLTRVHSVTPRWTNVFLLILQMFWKIIQLWNLKESTLSRQSCLLHKPFSSYTRKFALWERTSHYRRAQQLKVLWPAKTTSSTFFWQSVKPLEANERQHNF